MQPTKLKLVNCSGVDVGGDTLFSFSALATIAGTCDALESLEIVGNETLSKSGSRTTPLRFSSLIVLRVERCPVLSSIGVIFDRANGSGGTLLVSGCPTLAQVLVSGKIASRSWRWNGVEAPEAFIKLIVPAEHCAKFAVSERILCLGDIKLGVEGARKLGEALKPNTTLTTLNLHSNNVRNEGARKLAEALKTNTTLTTLKTLRKKRDVICRVSC